MKIPMQTIHTHTHIHTKQNNCRLENEIKKFRSQYLSVKFDRK